MARHNKKQGKKTSSKPTSSLNGDNQSTGSETARIRDHASNPTRREENHSPGCSPMENPMAITPMGSIDSTRSHQSTETARVRDKEAPPRRRLLPISITPTGSINSRSSSPSLSASNEGTHAENTNEPSYDLKSFMDEQRSFNDRVLNILSTSSENQPRARTRKERLPLKITSSIRCVYQNLQESDENSHWDFEKSFVCPENASINCKITEGVRSTEKDVSATVIRDAMRAHFKTKKRQYVMAKKSTKNDYLKQQRLRSRMNTKRLQRKKALLDSTTLTEEDKDKMKPILTNNTYISSDESVSDSSDREGSDSDTENDASKKCKTLITKRLPWRSPECSAMMQRLDKRVNRKRSQKGSSMVIPRRVGPPSTRLPPINALEWAVL